MQLDLKIDKALPIHLLRPAIEHRARFALTRLHHELRVVTVVLERETAREGGEYRCRVSGALRRGGSLDVDTIDPLVPNAVGRALARFRRSVLRRADRRATHFPARLR